MEQRSEEWYAIRKGKMTASKAHVVITNGTGLDTYISELMAEYYSSEPQEQISNKDIQRGIDLEPQARNMFMLETGLIVKQVGFIIVNEYVGCSPDGLIDDDGLVEYKCPNDKNYFQLLLTEKIKPEYISQMQWQMHNTKRNYCYFCAYNPNFERSLFIKKIEKDLDTFNKIDIGIQSGITKIEKIKEKIKNGQI